MSAAELRARIAQRTADASLICAARAVVAAENATRWRPSDESEAELAAALASLREVVARQATPTP
jgi:hypothetical protein